MAVVLPDRRHPEQRQEVANIRQIVQVNNQHDTLRHRDDNKWKTRIFFVVFAKI